MTKDRDGSSLKSNKHNKKQGGSTTDSAFSGFLKKQNDLVSGLKTELQNSIAEKQQIKFAAMERNKCIQELQKSIEDRDAEIKKLERELSVAREENTKTLQDFYTFKEKFFELETHYDNECQKQNRKIECLKQQEEEQVRELTLNCESLRQQLHEQRQAYAKLGFDYAELKEQFERNHQEFGRQQVNFENFKKHMEMENSVEKDKMKNEINALKQELLHKNEEFLLEKETLQNELLEKDELIKQCIKDKDIVENEKNRKIQELNYKIKQIEKVFGQPTKSVPPVLSISNSPQTNNDNQQTTKSTNNVAITKPQLRLNESENITNDKEEIRSDSNNNQLPETSHRIRAKKIPRPSHIAGNNGNNLQNNLNNNNKKRENLNDDLQQFKNPSPPPKKRNSFSSTGDDDDDDIFIPQWGPSRYVPETETDASESFFKPKRSKK